MTTNYGTVKFKKCATDKISNFRLSGTELDKKKDCSVNTTINDKEFLLFSCLLLQVLLLDVF